MKKILLLVVLALMCVALLFEMTLVSASASSRNEIYVAAWSGVIPLEIDNQQMLIEVNDIKPDLLKFAEIIRTGASVEQKATCSEIRKIAQNWGMFDETDYNPHLSFLSGDIAYWCAQGLSVKRINFEFMVRKIILDNADKDRIIISDQGKLSWGAQSIMADILRLLKN